MMNRFLTLIYIVAFLTGIGLPAKGQPRKSHKDSTTRPVLVFQNGFEGSSRIIRNSGAHGDGISHYDVDDIIGKDTRLKLKSDWVKDMDENPDGGQFMLEYTGGDSSKRNVNIIEDPGNPKNKVLAFTLNDSWEASEHQVKARIQADIYGIKTGYKEFYQAERVFIPADFNRLRKYPGKIGWLTISEFWNNEWWVPTEKYGFRITLGIGKLVENEGDLVFILNAQDAGEKEVWNANDNPVKVPIGKWFTMEYYFKEGDDKKGRFYMAITPEGGSKQVVFNVFNYTQNTKDPHPNGVTGYSPMKLYTSKDVIGFMKAQGKPLQIYWDDFKLWKNKRP